VQKQIDQLINIVRQGFSSEDISEEDVLIDVSQYTYPVHYNIIYMHGVVTVGEISIWN